MSADVTGDPIPRTPVSNGRAHRVTDMKVWKGRCPHGARIAAALAHSALHSGDAGAVRLGAEGPVIPAQHAEAGHQAASEKLPAQNSRREFPL